MKKYLYIATFIASFLLLGFSSQAQKLGGNPGTNNGNSVNRCQLFVPNAFTPNGDDINDHFTIKFNDDCMMAEFDLKIFDRWGRLVYETDNADALKAWDGKSDGKDQKEGVYMWRLYAKLVDPSRNYEAHILNKQGTVVLIR